MNAFKQNFWKVHRWLARHPSAVKAAIKLRNHADCVIAQFLQPSFQHHENGEELILRHLGPSLSSFVDVGANVGSWTALALKYGSRGIQGVLYEPGEQAFDDLTRRFGSNSALVLRGMGVSDENRTREFFEIPNNAQLSSLLDLANPASISRRISVRTLDSDLTELGWTSVDFLKVDAEGHDLHVLRGAKRLLSEQRIGFVQFEYNVSWQHDRSTLQEAKELFVSCGMDMFLLRPEGLLEIPLDQFGEYYRYSNYLAVSRRNRDSVDKVLRRW